MGYQAVFVGTGAGSPKFAQIPGEAYNGVFSANEFLTRVNLMRGYRQPLYDTLVGMGKRAAVVGAGNTAMDACRVDLRMGAGEVTCMYRRTRRESPARAEELEHAIEEGVEFMWLTAPVEIVGDSSGWVTGMRCQRMELGEPDASGRRWPVPVAGSEFVLDVNKWGYIEIDERTRDAVQFELDSFHFYKLARDKARTPEQRAVLEGLYEAELDHLHELEEKYHAHLDRSVVELSSDEQDLLSNWLFRGIQVTDDSGLVELYQAALEMERRTRDHFKKLARELPAGLERELCEELAAEEEEHVAMLETELEQIS
jgi:rubrerythrin